TPQSTRRCGMGMELIAGRRRNSSVELIDDEELTEPVAQSDEEEVTEFVEPEDEVAGSTDALQLFLAEVSRYPLLAPLEEIALAKRIEPGDGEATESVINATPLPVRS